MEPTARMGPAVGAAALACRPGASPFSLTAKVYGVCGTCWSLVPWSCPVVTRWRAAFPPVGSTVVVAVFGRDR